MLVYEVWDRPSMLRTRKSPGRSRRNVSATSRLTRYLRSTRSSCSARSRTSASPTVPNAETSRGAGPLPRIGALALQHVDALHRRVRVRPLPPGVLDGVPHRDPGGLADEVHLVDCHAERLQR